MTFLKKTTTQLWETLNESKDAKEFIEENKEEMINTTLSEHLNYLLKKSGLTKKEVIKNSNIQRSYGYHLFAGTKTNPSRNHILQLAFGMRLTLEETKRLLRIANLNELYPRRKFDSIIIFCLNNSFTLEQCYDLLEQNGCDFLYEI